MNRRSFVQSIPAAGVAPWVTTTAGVLMPVRALSVPVPIVVPYSNFGKLSDEQRKAWLRSLWNDVNDHSFLERILQK